MSILKAATEQTQSEFVEIPEGLWRWEIRKVELTFSPEYQKWGPRFTLRLTEEEIGRLTAEHGAAPEGKQQSFQTTYKTGLSLGWFKDGQYHTTKLVDFLAVCFGAKHQRRFRDWIGTGGKPPTRDDMTEEEELKTITDWLGWWQELQLYGSIKHEPDSKDPNRVWARFGGPMPVGSLPGQPEDGYQAFGLGKLRAMLAESGSPSAAKPEPAQPRSYGQVFGDDAPKPAAGVAVAERPQVKDLTPDEIKDLPF